MSDTIFDKIIRDEIKSYKIWEDEHYLAFLTPFPNTPGASVVIPKTNQGDYLFDLSEAEISSLIQAATSVAKLLKSSLQVARVAMVVEGTGVPYVHVKLYPLHGKLAERTDVWSSHQEFYPKYVGYLTTVEGPLMSDQELKKIQTKIIKKQP
jgi:diadenosine tetraphosphate (Ap4A) HIT family hydrolase